MTKTQLELHAYLQHVEASRLGFAVQHVDRENIEPLRKLLEAHMDIARWKRNCSAGVISFATLAGHVPGAARPSAGTD